MKFTAMRPKGSQTPVWRIYVELPDVDNRAKRVMEEVEVHSYWMETLDAIKKYNDWGLRVLLRQTPKMPGSEYNAKIYEPSTPASVA